jgi:hypothetical protein
MYSIREEAILSRPSLIAMVRKLLPVSSLGLKQLCTKLNKYLIN